MEQLPAAVGEFAAYLRDLLARVDESGGWCGVFWQRDPDGMTACLHGWEVPPWDVVEALLQDLSTTHGQAAADHETPWARALHDASLQAYDAHPGAHDLLGDRLDVMLREQRYAAERIRELGELLRTAAPDDAERVQVDLAWAHDDHDRATARCAELRTRMERVRDTRPGPSAPPAAVREHPEPRTTTRAPRPRGARYAGLDLDDGTSQAADPVPTSAPTSAPTSVFADPHARAPHVSPPATAATPRGARYAGLTDDSASSPETRPQTSPDTSSRPAPAASRATADAVEDLLTLRGQGRSGEAYAVLCEAAQWPAPQLPPLAAALHRAGLGADWATLLWEVASLPPDRLAAAADALTAAGRADDCHQLLRQGAARPAPEIAAAIRALDDAGRGREADALLEAYVRVRTPEEAARVAQGDPQRLVPRLLDTARAVSAERHRDLTHALRVSGLST
ncbi:hypothetical protein [Streptomyces apocyni]|uniref:hypothetical protein n=1 Tax=Streptomyces apocyni TaxID=2654677 RepID=UPI0012EACC18|nr:hypothetical protein [Streptomyces apocyni]